MHRLSIVLGILTFFSSLTNANIIYTQDFENPSGFVDTTNRDVSGQTVNSLYGGQPDGFFFAQTNSVETLNITGGQAFGSGYQDPRNQAGNFIIGLLATDLLGLAFNVGNNDFLNIGIDITSIDLNCCGGFFVNSGEAPLFRFSLFDNPTGNVSVGSGLRRLDFFDALGTESARNVVDFTNFVFGLDASDSTNGNVILGIDLINGTQTYAGLDNIVVAASNVEAQLVSEPGSAMLLGLAIGAMALSRRRKLMSY